MVACQKLILRAILDMAKAVVFISLGEKGRQG